MSLLSPLCLFHFSFSDSCPAIILSLTFVLHICPLILYVNRQFSEQNRVLVQPAAVNIQMLWRIAKRGV
jgi:hypothetical protein